MTAHARPVMPRGDRLMPGTKATVDFGDYGQRRVTVQSGPDTEGRYLVLLRARSAVLAHRRSLIV